ncbi:MAG: hypothetical protein IJN77_05390 [Oscillospiraceae bacterium]|nr:hypothetical protein [Oscillospiraceae bacterium]MBQ6850453.1 hypothetical protein [Oscillospiraceae bacterium]MBR6610581.1 hypothetical protein [Oscillospiraceae bacterium]
MEKVKKAIVYIWIFGLLIAMYSAEAWSYTYLRQHGSEHPKENMIFGILLLAFLIPFAILLIVNKFKNKDKPKQKIEFTWSGLATAFIICGGHDFLQSRAMNMVNTARAAPTAVNIENAKTDIITLYAVYFIALTVFCIVADFFEKKYKKNKIDTEETAG